MAKENFRGGSHIFLFLSTWSLVPGWGGHHFVANLSLCIRDAVPDLLTPSVKTAIFKKN